MQVSFACWTKRVEVVDEFRTPRRPMSLSGWRRLQYGLPTLSAGVLRINQFLVMVVITRLAGRGFSDFAAAAVGTMTAFTIFSDSGSANYILSHGRDGITGREYRTCILVHLAIGLTGLLLAWLLLAGRAPSGTTAQLWTVIVATGLAQVLDSLFRVVRAPLLNAGRDASFATPEISLGLAKLATMTLTVALGSLSVLIVLPLLDIVILLMTSVRVRGLVKDSDPGSAPAPVRTVWRILKYGLSGAASALYSQMPVIIGSAMLPLGAAATLAITYRVVQPLEIVPSSVSTQLMPRVRDGSFRPWRWWGLFLGYGVLVEVGLVLIRDIVPTFFGTGTWSMAAYLLIGASMPLKSGNYLLVARVLGHGGVDGRLRVTVVVGLVTTGILAAFGSAGSVTGIAAVTPTVELVMCLCLGGLARRLEARR